MGRSSEGKEAQEKRIVNRLPHYGLFERARLGYFSLTTPETKFISREDSLTIEGETETPGYFFGKFMRPLWTGKKAPGHWTQLHYPHKAIPGKFPGALYVDIRHAFRQIASAFGVEVFIHEGKMCAYGETTCETPCFDNKICRGLLVTGTGPKGSYQEWINHDLRTVTFSNPGYAPHVRYAIWATLHAIQAVVNPYTIYAHTDGFIIPNRHAAQVFRILDQTGFRYSVKYSGCGEIYGTANYRIGNHRSATTNRDVDTRSNIREENSNWWLAKFSTGLGLRNDTIHAQLYGHEKADE